MAREESRADWVLALMLPKSVIAQLKSGQGLAYIARHVVDTRSEPSFLELKGII